MIDWVPIALQGVSMLLTIGGVVAVVSTRIARLEGRIENLSTEIRKDRELVEHRIRQLEIGLGQVRSELTRLAFGVGHMKGREQHPTENEP
jgi:tRNA A58 N-methylase Trm61